MLDNAAARELNMDMLNTITNARLRTIFFIILSASTILIINREKNNPALLFCSR